MSIVEWPAAERPREKFLARGPASLSDAELLALFIRIGSRGRSAVDIARDLLGRYGGLRELGLDLWKPEGAFYVFPKIKNSNKAVNDLYYKYKVITYDGAWFGAPNRVRFSYALEIEKIKEGLDRIKQYFTSMKSY